MPCGFTIASPIFFPSSPLAGEALYRSADIRWQLDKTDVMSKPSARETGPVSARPDWTNTG